VFASLIGTRGGDVALPIALGIAAQSDIAVMGSQVGLAPTTTFVSGAMTITFGMVFALHGVQLSGASDSLVLTTTAADGTQTQPLGGHVGSFELGAADRVQSMTLASGAVGLLARERRRLRSAAAHDDVDRRDNDANDWRLRLDGADRRRPSLTWSSLCRRPPASYAAAGAGAGVLLLIIVLVIVCCCLVRRGRQRGAKSIPDAIMVSIRRSSYRAPHFQTEMQLRWRRDSAAIAQIGRQAVLGVLARHRPSAACRHRRPWLRRLHRTRIIACRRRETSIWLAPMTSIARCQRPQSVEAMTRTTTMAAATTTIDRMRSNQDERIPKHNIDAKC
jgi:hypothetical protein